MPVRYYRDPPNHFRGWQRDVPPCWGEHWGNEWQQQHRGWDRWNRNAMPAPARLPRYQRQYSGERYPQAEQQRDLQSRSYRYQPRYAVVREHVQAQAPRHQGGPGQGNGKAKGRDKDDDRGKRPKD